MYVITEWLATHGIEQQYGEQSQDYPLLPDANGTINGFKIFDIRERLMDAPTDLYIYRRLVNEAFGIVKEYGKIVICCSAGVSRSNSIAIALLMRGSGMSFKEASLLVSSKVPISNPLPCHLEKIQML